ncbi:MAG: phosphate acetyltransferase [Spirochaetales bacterium]|nr:phosphate acetyltransferase [Spirochaetales bacterium]
MTFSDLMLEKAKKKYKRLVLPEGTEQRTISAARIILDRKVASAVTLVGNIKEIHAGAAALNVSLDGIALVQPDSSPDLGKYAEEYYELRKHKGISREEARTKITDNLLWGAMMVRMGESDAMVAGAENATGKVVVAAVTIIKTAPGTRYASSCFVMSLDDPKWGYDGSLIFADCGTIPDPDAEQLAEIAIASAESCRTYFGEEPKVALLSYSTKGSAESPMIDKVRKAVDILNEKKVDFEFDGELQGDAALVPSVAQKKAPGSTIAGKANVLIFPDLQAGNIAYKLVERLAGAQAYGPLLQGFAKPVSDLSRGCSIDDIVTISAITLAQCK